MTRPARTVLIALVALGSSVAFAASGCSAPGEVSYPNPERPAPEKVEALKNRAVGMSGCLAAACHGGPAQDALEGRIDMQTWQSSGTCWAAADPHTAAYSLLTEKPHRLVKVTAREIMARYAPGKNAEDDARCVACHTNPALARAELMHDPHAQTLRTEGVSCEACHGNAGAWVSAHTTWKGDRAKVYADHGMVPLYDIGERAMNCLGCHVGAPADVARGLPLRDMNHDMIAAGHPRLNFDFAEYLRRLPPHWQEKNRSVEPPEQLKLNPAKAWLVGRVAHADAACRLLADRAAKPGDESRPWPEFAEYNCAACHHQLKAPEQPGVKPPWRQDANYLAGRAPGVAPWQTIWPMTPAAGIPTPSRKDSPLGEVLGLAERPKHPRAGLPEVARNAAEALRADRVKLVALPDAEALHRAEAFFPPSGAPSPGVPEWDSGAQLFFGFAALERARRGGQKVAPPEFQSALDALRPKEQKGQYWPEYDWPALKAALKKIQESPR